MVNRLLQPQEIEVFYVLPAVRREIAIVMKADGKSQKEIAGLLGVTEPAVSQYMSAKRASTFQLNDKVKSAIRESVARITGEIALMREMQRLLVLVREERLVCQAHEALGGAPKGCSVCFETDGLIQIKQ